MIGFTFDSIKCTIHLPLAKVAAFIKATHHLLCRTLALLKTLQTLVGILRHASIILLDAHSFFIPINAARHGGEKKICLGQLLDI